LRVINIPNAKVASHFWITHSGIYKYGCISNVRIAKGAVPLYDRLMNDGKIISYGITFETGKADIKPESMVEIARSRLTPVGKGSHNPIASNSTDEGRAKYCWVEFVKK
jgi:hypothetical protein